MPFAFQDIYCTSSDGLKLHARVIGPESAGRLPLLCLPGLTRTTADFDSLAFALANDARAPRRVVSLDYRGRGLSDHDPNAANYTIPVEAGDVLAVAAAAGITCAIVLGTSRGGIIAMVLAATRPNLLAGVILNDVGPELDIKGLLRIKSYIANPPPRRTWDEAARGLKDLFGRDFPCLSDADWMAWAHRAFRESGDGLVRTYDEKLGHVFDAIDEAHPPPPLWDLFDQLPTIPLMVIRGALSDLLAASCVEAMMQRRPDMDYFEVPAQGHAPLLDDAQSVSNISAFCMSCD